jgi:hypothetical protein
MAGTEAVAQSGHTRPDACLDHPRLLAECPGDLAVGHT